MSPRAAITDPHRQVNDTDVMLHSFTENKAQKNNDPDAREPTQAVKNQMKIDDNKQKSYKLMNPKLLCTIHNLKN